MIACDELERTGEEAMVNSFKVISRHSASRAKKNLQIIFVVINLSGAPAENRKENLLNTSVKQYSTS
jgi:hypothetical protein